MDKFNLGSLNATRGRVVSVAYFDLIRPAVTLQTIPVRDVAWCHMTSAAAFLRLANWCAMQRVWLETLHQALVNFRRSRPDECRKVMRPC